MVNINYYSTDEMIDNLQELKGKIELKFYKNISNYYDNLNIRIDEDTFVKMLKVLVKFIIKSCC